jgi:hypothetical protein
MDVRIGMKMGRRYAYVYRHHHLYHHHAFKDLRLVIHSVLEITFHKFYIIYTVSCHRSNTASPSLQIL